MRLIRLLFVSALCALVACGAESAAELASIEPQRDALSDGCSASWDNSIAYVAGNTVSVAGNNYEANWWTQGEDPSTQSGPAGSGKPWTLLGSCAVVTTGPVAPTTPADPAPPATTAGTTTATPNTADCAAGWAASGVYTSGMSASINNINYTANWWTQGDNPATNSGPSGSGEVWTSLGPCSQAASTSAPTTPSGTGSSTPTAPAAPVSYPAPTASSAFVLSAYKDVSISANWNTSVISTAVTGTLLPLLQLASQVPAVTWSFATGECGSENWGGIAAEALASANVAAWSDAQKPYVISTGGAAGAFTCASDAGFGTFLDRYISPYMVGVDFDIEAGQSQAQIDALVQRVQFAQSQSQYAHLRFSFTIATFGGNNPQSLGGAGMQVMHAVAQAGLENYYINLMAMDYGAASPGNCTQNQDGTCAMGLSATQAAINLHQTYAVPYAQIELTPMIGGNDTQSEVFTFADADVVTAFAKSHALGGLHFWSLDRDRDCATGSASPICNSYGQAGTLGFSQRFATGLQ